MSFWKGLVDKVAQKKEELEHEAKRRAAKKAAELAVDTSKAAAKAAVKNAAKTLDYAGKKLEEAIFGPSEAGEREAPSSSGEARPDPFAKLKAAEAAKKAAMRRDASGTTTAGSASESSDRSKADRDADRARAEREVDDELAALKKKIRG